MDDESLPAETEISEPQARVLAKLLCGAGAAEAAIAGGVVRSTVWKWRTRDPAFRAALSQARAEVRRRLLDAASAGALEAVARVRELLLDEDSGIALGAARLLLGAVTGRGAPVVVDAEECVGEDGAAGEVAALLSREERARIIAAIRRAEGSRERPEPVALPAPLEN